MQEHGKATGHESGSLDEEFKKRKEKRAQAAYASEREREERLKDRPTQEWEKERTTEEQIAVLMEVEQKMAYQPPKEAPKTAEKQPVNKLEGVKVPPRKPKTPKASAKAQKVTPKAPVVDTAKVKQESDQDRDYRLYYSEVKGDYVSGRSVQQVNILQARFESFDASIGHKVGSKAWVDALTTKFDGIRWIKPYLIEEGKADPEQEETKVEAATEEPESYTLQNSVGDGGVNFKEDVGYIQELLLELGVLSESGFQEENGAAMHSPKVVEQGDMPKTIAAIELFQREVLHWTNIDGKVDAADSKTLTALESVGMDYDYVKSRIAMYPSVKARKEKAAQEKEEAQEIQMAQEVTQNRLTPYAQLIAEEIPDLYKVAMSPTEFNLKFRPEQYQKLKATRTPDKREQLYNEASQAYTNVKDKVLKQLRDDYFIGVVDGRYTLDTQWMFDKMGQEEVQKNMSKYESIRARARNILADPSLDRHLFGGQAHSELAEFLDNKANEKVAPEEQPQQAYHPRAMVRLLEWFMKDDNQVPSSGEFVFKVLISGKYLIFKLALKFGAGIEMEVRDDRSFAVDISWTLGAELGASSKLGKASVGYDFKTSMDYFKEINGRYESTRHFASVFHNSLMRFCMDSDINPAKVGLDPDSVYWKENEEELTKPYTQEKKTDHKGYLKGETALGSKGEASVTKKTVNREQHQIEGVGEAPERTNKPAEEKTRITTAFEASHRKGIGLAVEYNCDENGVPQFIDFKASYKNDTKKDDQNEKAEGLAKVILDLKANPDQSIVDSIKKLAPRLIEILTPDPSSNWDGKVGSKVEAKFRVAFLNHAWHFQYVRFSYQLSGELSNDSSPVGFETEANRTTGFLEVLGHTHIDYISKLYNNMVFEQTGTEERDRVSKSLKGSKSERKGARPEKKLELLGDTWKDQPMPKSSHWETYRDAHKDGIKKIMDNFAKGVEKALAECNEQTWGDMKVMGVPLEVYFGDYENAKSHPLVDVIRKGKSAELETSFEQHVLFNKYKEFLVNEKHVDL